MSPGDRLPAIVIGGGVNALSIVRSLGRHGVPVDVLASAGTPLSARHSRFCRRYIERPAPVQEEWLNWLLDERGAQPSVLLPAGDEALEMVAGNLAKLVEAGHRPMEMNDQVVLAMLDKARTYELARDAGIPAPRAMLLKTVDDIGRAGSEMPYPAVLKPRHSHLFLRSFAGEQKGSIITSDSELNTVATPILEAGVEMLLMELVPGRHDAFCSYYTYLDAEGQPLVEVTKRKLRQHPIRFGEGTYHEMAAEPEAAELGLAFFQRIGLRGLGNVEFKRDGRDGTLKLIECNLRFTQADALLQRAGVDLPRLVYARAAGEPDPEIGQQRNGLHLWFPRRDLKAFLELRDAGEITAGAWLRSMIGRQCLPQLDRTDLQPTVQGARRRLRSIAQLIRGRNESTRGVER